MASIVKRRKKFSVVYSYVDERGEKRQKWETFSTMADAKKRKAEIETQQEDGTFQIPTCTTLDELLEEYVQTYGVNTWALSTYEARKAMIENYISPIIGDMKLTDITPRVMDQYYRNLLQVKSVAVKFHNPRTEFVTPSRIREIHKLLSTAFKHAVKWDLISRNPVENATLPKEAKKERAIWTAENLMHALEICDDEMLYLAINLAFSCSLRIGEMLGLTWDCVEISEESIRNGEAYIFVNKELQRASRDAMEALDDKDVIFKFPPALKSTHTCLLLKTPKTKTSVRKVFLPKTVAELLIKQKAEQEEYKELFGAEYLDYNLVFAGVNGRPVEGQLINKMFRDLIEKGNLPKVVFHSLRHSSITYKLKLTGGNLKSVQGDSGHAQTKMITDVYSHILDDDRKLNAQKFEQVFYSGKKKEDEIPAEEPEAEIEAEVIEETTFIPDSPSEAVVEEVVEKVTETVTQTESAPAPRKRGRPRKVVQEAPAEVKEESVTETTTTPAADKELLLKLLEKPEMAQLLKALAQTL